MLMPIVSMNQMAMNESVAATCCFKQSAATSNVYWETLHGGYIGRGYVEYLNRVSGLNTQWLRLPNDMSQANFNEPNNYYRGGGTFYLGDDNTWYCNYNGALVPIWGDDTPYSKGHACAHDDGNCIYFDWEIVNESNVHFDSKTKHNVWSGQSWDKPHTASQFQS